MKLCGHTMGMPNRDIFESISLCAQIGYDGIEVRCAENGQMHLEELSPDEIQRIKQHAEDEGVEFACLTPYYRDFMIEATKAATLDGYRLACGIARELACPLVRAISGTWPNENFSREEVFARTVSGMKEAALIADHNGVRLAVETHRGQLTWSAAETLEFVEAVDHPAVGVLYDAYWVEVRGEEDLGQQISMLSPWIIHVHAKNVRYDDEGEAHATLLDEGEMDWCQIITLLDAIGYDGYISDEYEKLWRPAQFPEPEVGMKRNHEVLRECLIGLGELE
ncbi:MAG: sugar phosphate isomerase/epimerase family protein [Armatimonadota bacterium]